MDKEKTIVELVELVRGMEGEFIIRVALGEEAGDGTENQ
jgi:hypothetical protein